MEIERGNTADISKNGKAIGRKSEKGEDEVINRVTPVTHRNEIFFYFHLTRILPYKKSVDSMKTYHRVFCNT